MTPAAIASRSALRGGTGLLLAAALAPALMAAPAQGQAGADGERIYQQLLKSTVWVIAGTNTGTGSLVDAERKLIVTNHHVVGDLRTVEILFPRYDSSGRVIAERADYLRRGRRVRGVVLLRDGRRDLAVIQLTEVPVGTPALRLAAESPRPGAQVHSIGNPSVSGALWVYTSGSVRQVYRRTFRLKDGREIDARVVETQSPINSGDSGGPVVNDKGELVAVVQSYEGADARLVSTFIDVSEIRTVIGAAVRSPAPPVPAPPTPNQNPAAVGPRTAPPPATARPASARILSVRQEHNVERGGKSGMALHVAFDVRNARGIDGELVAIFHDRDGKPIKAAHREYGNAAGELCAFQKINPGYDATVYKDMVLFLPYEAMPLGKGRTELRFSINVWIDSRWVADKALWGAFLLTQE